MMQPYKTFVLSQNPCNNSCQRIPLICYKVGSAARAQLKAFRFISWVRKGRHFAVALAPPSTTREPSRRDNCTPIN